MFFLLQILGDKTVKNVQIDKIQKQRKYGQKAKRPVRE